MKIEYAWIAVFFIIALMLIHIEFILNKKYAPETILVRVTNDAGIPEIGDSCFADIISEQVNVEKKPMKELDSLYDFVDAKQFHTDQGDKGYYLLESGFDNYSGEYEIRVVCYSPGFKGVSYSIINSSNQNCEFFEGGGFVVC